MPAQGDKSSTILVIHFNEGDAAVLMVKLGTRQNTSVYRGECMYHTCRDTFKDKARLQIHSKNFGLEQLCNSLNSFYF